MLALINIPLKPPPRLIRDLLSPSSAIDQSMANCHTCPCCSYTLLRHARFGKLYWRCSHCHEEMPAWA